MTWLFYFAEFFTFFPRLYIDTKKQTPNDDGIYIILGDFVLGIPDNNNIYICTYTYILPFGLDSQQSVRLMNVLINEFR